MLGQTGGYFDCDAHILVTTAAAVYILNALSFQAEYCTILRAFRNGVFHFAVNRGHLKGIAQSCLWERNRNITNDVIAVTVKNRMRTNGNRDNYISVRPAIGTRVALTTQLDRLSIINTCGNLDFQRAAFAHLTRTAALFTRFADNLTRTAAVGAGGLCLEHTEWGALGLGHHT